MKSAVYEGYQDGTKCLEISRGMSRSLPLPLARGSARLLHGTTFSPTPSPLPPHPPLSFRSPPSPPPPPPTSLPPSSATRVFDFQIARRPRALYSVITGAAPFREAIPAADEWPTLEWTNDNSIRTRAVRIAPRRRQRWRWWYCKNDASAVPPPAVRSSVNCCTAIGNWIPE